MNDMIKKIESELISYLPKENEYIKTLVASMNYSLTAGGKRIRPMLAIEFARLCGGSEEAVMPFACAVEMIHTYSLIHDDLPCMDNDDLRRGKPTNHKIFGEAAAVLGGNGLLTLAFETVLSEKAVSLNGYEKCVKAGRLLADCSGVNGMLGGQIIDIESEGKKVSADHLRMMDDKKTGALIKASCLLGCISAGANEEKIKAAGIYAENIGITFQIVDDILDVISDTATLGKTVGSDEQNSKSTYVTILGLDECRKLTDSFTKAAIDSLSGFTENTAALSDFAVYLRDRIK